MNVQDLHKRAFAVRCDGKEWNAVLARRLGLLRTHSAQIGS